MGTTTVVNRCGGQACADEFHAPSINHIELIICRYEHGPTEMMRDSDVHSIDGTYDERSISTAPRNIPTCIGSARPIGDSGPGSQLIIVAENAPTSPEAELASTMLRIAITSGRLTSPDQKRP
jgi:hypothetical protein